MARLIVRKVLLILLLLPLLNVIGFHYATIHPRLLPGGSSARQFSSQPMPRYEEYVQGILQGDWGRVDGQPILTLVAKPLRDSVILLLVALAATVVLGPMLGVLSISRRTRRIKPLALLISTLGLSMPGFFLGVAVIGLMIYGTLYASARTTFLPLSGFGLDRHLILPVLVLASRPALQVARVTAGLLEHELQQDYVRVAQSKGLGWSALFWEHAFPNAVSQVVVAVGQSTRLLISGLIIVEALFLWPGIGRLFMLDLGLRTDGRSEFGFFAHPEVLAILAVLFGALLLLSDLIASILAHWLDPRLARPNNYQTA